jgi:hypothetical protein
MRSLYQAEVTQADFWLGRIMEQLRSTGLLEDTVIVFCSDHGYYLGEHNRVGKLFKPRTGPNVIYEELARVPLLIRHPSGIGLGRDTLEFASHRIYFQLYWNLPGCPRSDGLRGRVYVGVSAGSPKLNLSQQPGVIRIAGTSPAQPFGRMGGAWFTRR